jgi:hypothetical protein
MAERKIKNVVPENMRSYIDPNDLLRRLKHLFPSVTSVDTFRLDVRFLVSLPLWDYVDLLSHRQEQTDESSIYLDCIKLHTIMLAQI